MWSADEINMRDLRNRKLSDLIYKKSGSKEIWNCDVSLRIFLESIGYYLGTYGSIMFITFTFMRLKTSKGNE